MKAVAGLLGMVLLHSMNVNPVIPKPNLNSTVFFRALKSTKIYIVGIQILVVEVDTSYIKGMINWPDVQPNAAMNRWIAGILLFDFDLRHVPGLLHPGSDGLSRRRLADGETVVEDQEEDWVLDVLAVNIMAEAWLLDPSYAFLWHLNNSARSASLFFVEEGLKKNS